MKFLLIPNPFIINNSPRACVPLGLICIATVLRNAGVEAEIIDINSVASDATFNNVPEEIMAKEPDIIGFTTVSAYYHITLRLAHRCKEMNPDVKIVFGGPQATLTDIETIKSFPYVDVIVRGEAEGTIVQVIEALSNRRDLHEVSGVTFRNQKGIVRAPQAPLIKDLDALPEPVYHLFPSMHNVNAIYIEEGRGCPYNCSFCCANQFWRRTFRVRRVERIVSLIKKLTIDYGNEKTFVFVQDTPFLSRDRMAKLCEAIKRENMDIRWRCYSRIDLLDEDILHLMADAGCESIFFGVESGSTRMQELIGKKLNLSRAIETARCITGQGIEYTASFIMGFPDEKLEDIEQTINLLTGLKYSSGKCQEIQFHRLNPLVGSRLYEEYGTELLFDGNFWGAWSYSKLCDEDVKMVREHPELFPSFYYYPSKYLDREFLLRIHFVISNLQYLPYTGFILYKNDLLRFPKCILKYQSLLNPPQDYQKKFGTYESLVQICRFLEAILRQLGIEEHFIRDVMRYELAAKKVRDAENMEVPKEIEAFDNDVEGFISEIDTNAFQRLPEVVGCERYFLLFTKKDEKVVTVKLPAKLAPIFSLHKKTQEPIYNSTGVTV